MHLDWLSISHQRTAPYNLAQAQDLSLLQCCTSHSLSNRRTRHLQVGYPWHDSLPFDDMIGQEKFLTVKSRTEPLCEEIRVVVLHQRMQHRAGACVLDNGATCSKQARPTGDPVTFAG